MQTKVLLSEKDMPRKWYNILADLKGPMDPYLHPMTLQPLTPQDLSALFPMALIEQEVSSQRWIDIPEEVLDVLALWRPSPLYRAHHLEKALGTTAKIYYKWEGVSPAGSHKPNTAVAQAYYNKKEGINRLTTETGAGQWGSALSMACNYFDIDLTVYMVKVSYQQKPYRRSMIETWGAKVYPSPTTMTNAGRSILEKDPDCLGSLGIAISEAVEDAMTHEDTHYSLGSVLNHVLMHQTVIGLEAQKQMKMVNDAPDVVIGCVGGGSNFGGLSIPFAAEKINGKDIDIIAVEPTACPTITKGTLAYDFGDTTKIGPVAMMHTLGHDFVPPGIHAGGLRYHGMSPIVSKLVKDGIARAVAYHQNPVFDAAVQFARSEGFIVAPETAHAIKAVIDEALKAKEEGKEKTILFNCSGHGHFDLASYDKYFAGELDDYEYPEAAIKNALKNLPKP